MINNNFKSDQRLNTLIITDFFETTDTERQWTKQLEHTNTFLFLETEKIIKKPGNNPYLLLTHEAEDLLSRTESCTLIASGYSTIIAFLLYHHFPDKIESMVLVSPVLFPPKKITIFTFFIPLIFSAWKSGKNYLRFSFIPRMLLLKKLYKMGKLLGIYTIDKPVVLVMPTSSTEAKWDSYVLKSYFPNVYVYKIYQKIPYLDKKERAYKILMKDIVLALTKKGQRKIKKWLSGKF